MPQDDLPELQPVIFVQRIILFSLLMGVATFAGIGIAIMSIHGPMIPLGDGLVSFILCAMMLPPLLLQFVLPRLIQETARKKIAAEPESAVPNRLLTAYRSNAIMAWGYARERHSWA